MINDVKCVCISEERLTEIVETIGSQINKDYEGKNPMFIGLLKGCIPFMADLLKHVSIPCTQDYIKASSYDGAESTGNVVIKGVMPNVEGREVIIIDDILDTGRTLSRVVDLFKSMGAKSVEVCVLLDKPEGRVVPISPKYVGDLVPNEFVIGYGLDYNEKYRNLPFIGVLKEEVYMK